VTVALYQELPVFRYVYRLTLRVHQLTQGFSREFKFVLGQDIKRASINDALRDELRALTNWLGLR